MIGHQQKQIRPPKEFLLPMLNRFKDLFRHFRQSQLVSETLLAVDGDEIDFLVWINPQRNLMREMLAGVIFHGQRIFAERVEKTKNLPR